MKNSHLIQFKYFYIFTFVFFIFGFLFFIFTPAAQAQSPIQPNLQEKILKLGKQAAATGFGLAEQSLADIDIRIYIARTALGLLGYIGLIVTIFIVYSGFLYMTSAGNDEKTGKAKKMLAGTVIGALIIFSSYGIMTFVVRRMVRISFENMLNQSRSCFTSGATGNATCCQEWNAYDSAHSSVPGLCAGATTWSECGDDFAADWVRGTQRAEREYEQWRECWKRETDRMGIGPIDSNLFD